MNTKPASTSNESRASQRNLEVSPWTQQPAEEFESELRARFEQSLKASSPPTQELISIQSSGMNGVGPFVKQLLDDAAAVSEKTFVRAIETSEPSHIRRNIPASSMAIVVSGADARSSHIINHALGLANRYDIPIIGVFEKEEEVPSALMQRAKLMVLCEEGADLTQEVPFDRLPNRTTYRLSVSDSGEMEVAKQTSRAAPVQVLEGQQPDSHLPHITDLLNKRRQATQGPDSGRPSVASPTM